MHPPYDCEDCGAAAYGTPPDLLLGNLPAPCAEQARYPSMRSMTDRPLQLSRAELAALTPEEIDVASRAGQLDELLDRVDHEQPAGSVMSPSCRPQGCGVTQGEVPAPDSWRRPVGIGPVSPRGFSSTRALSARVIGLWGHRVSFRATCACAEPPGTASTRRTASGKACRPQSHHLLTEPERHTIHDQTCRSHHRPRCVRAR
jgi:hypothetical protein